MNEYINMTEKSHELLLPYLNQHTIALDLTLGNGYDTLFLSQHTKKIYSFDIQQQAIDQSLILLNSHGIKNVKLILDSHENILKYTKKFDVGIFNLGYLPGGDKAITTVPKSTFKALDILLSNNIKALVVVIYPGHEEGMKESLMFESFNLNFTKKYKITEIKNHHLSNKSPYIIFYEKK